MTTSLTPRRLGRVVPALLALTALTVAPATSALGCEKKPITPPSVITTVPVPTPSVTLVPVETPTPDITLVMTPTPTKTDVPIPVETEKPAETTKPAAPSTCDEASDDSCVTVVANPSFTG